MGRREEDLIRNVPRLRALSISVRQVASNPNESGSRLATATAEPFACTQDSYRQTDAPDLPLPGQ